MSRALLRLSGVICVSAALTACAARSGASPAADARWESLSDTLVCVVDRTTSTGLRELPGKVDADGTVLVRSGRGSAPLSTVHPVTLVAGYAGNESWSRGSEPLRFSGRSYLRTGGERRVPMNLLRRAGDHRGVPLFASPEEDSPEALYVPLRPGCVFQAYVREDLL